MRSVSFEQIMFLNPMFVQWVVLGFPFDVVMFKEFSVGIGVNFGGSQVTWGVEQVTWGGDADVRWD